MVELFGASSNEDEVFLCIHGHGHKQSLETLRLLTLPPKSRDSERAKPESKQQRSTMRRSHMGRRESHVFNGVSSPMLAGGLSMPFIVEHDEEEQEDVLSKSNALQRRLEELLVLEIRQDG